jgi:hypothetical protein
LIFLGGPAFQTEVKDGQEDVRGGDADGAPDVLAQQLRQGLGRAGLGDRHVHCGGAAAVVALVEVVDQVLVVRAGVPVSTWRWTTPNLSSMPSGPG